MIASVTRAAAATFTSCGRIPDEGQVTVDVCTSPVSSRLLSASFLSFIHVMRRFLQTDIYLSTVARRVSPLFVARHVCSCSLSAPPAVSSLRFSFVLQSKRRSHRACSCRLFVCLFVCSCYFCLSTACVVSNAVCCDSLSLMNTTRVVSSE